jgi:hypothetical protein
LTVIALAAGGVVVLVVTTIADQVVLTVLRRRLRVLGRRAARPFRGDAIPLHRRLAVYLLAMLVIAAFMAPDGGGVVSSDRRAA